MRDIAYFFELAMGIPVFMVYFFPFTLVVVGIWIGAWMATRDRLDDRRAKLAACCVFPAILTVAVLIVGVIFQVPEPPEVFSAPLKLPDYLIHGLCLAHLPLAVLLGLCSGRRWPMVVASSLVWGWATLCASIMSGMSVSGDWI
jgi:hypothetical protein